MPGTQHSSHSARGLNPFYAHAAGSSSSRHPVPEIDPLLEYARFLFDNEITYFDPFQDDLPLRPSKRARHGDHSSSSKSSSKSSSSKPRGGVVPKDNKSSRKHSRRRPADYRCKCERCKTRRQSTRAFTPIAQAEKIKMYSELEIKDGVPVYTDTIVWGPLRK
ncbi:hypothetical protein DENSPDRAFT_623608 [Dentipellis sp. KUC8613]|nr:hypothetical protein DENSPDRAFT_623608 [Dentipellis sp. KUC8613]